MLRWDGKGQGKVREEVKCPTFMTAFILLPRSRRSLNVSKWPLRAAHMVAV
jgi:hypothetical protein